MTITLDDYKKRLTPEQRAKVDELARKLLAEEKQKRSLDMDEDEPKESATV